MRKLSIVIITRNEGDKIAKVIESVLAATETLENVEIALVDSASTDNTTDIARQYPLKVIEIPANAFLSPAAGRYIGMQHTKSEYLYFLDGDMELDVSWFTTALPIIDANPKLAALAGKCHEISFNERGDIVSDNSDRFEVGNEQHYVNHLGQSVLYRRTVLEEVGGFNPYLTNEEELELGLRISQAGHQLLRIPKPMTIHHTLYYSQENPSGLTLRQVKRDWQLGRYIALGQVLRLLIGNTFIGDYLSLYRRALLFTGYYWLGIFALMLALVTHKVLFFTGWLAVIVVLFSLRALVKRNIMDTALYFFDYMLCAYGFSIGFWKALPPIHTYQPKVTVSQGT